MKNFFNGADAVEVAGLNTSSTDLGIMIKELMSKPDVVERCTEIVNDDKTPPLDMMVKLTGFIMEEKSSLQEYSMQDVYNATSRRLNTMSRKVAKNHGFDSYLKLAGGKVKKGMLLIEKQ
jgi:seryl-tRNA(Sec) selenium transferase